MVADMAAAGNAAGHPVEDRAADSVDAKGGDKVDSVDAKAVAGMAAAALKIEVDTEPIDAMSEIKHAKNGCGIPNPTSSKKTTSCFWSTNPQASPPAKANRPRLSIWSMSSRAPANA